MKGQTTTKISRKPEQGSGRSLSEVYRLGRIPLPSNRENKLSTVTEVTLDSNSPPSKS